MFTLEGTDLSELQQSKQRKALSTGRYNVCTIWSYATPQANHEGKVPVHGGEKLKSDTVQMQIIRVPKSKPIVDLPDGGQPEVGRMLRPALAQDEQLKDP